MGVLLLFVVGVLSLFFGVLLLFGWVFVVFGLSVCLGCFLCFSFCFVFIKRKKKKEKGKEEDIHQVIIYVYLPTQ